MKKGHFAILSILLLSGCYFSYPMYVANHTAEPIKVSLSYEDLEWNYGYILVADSTFHKPKVKYLQYFEDSVAVPIATDSLYHFTVAPGTTAFLKGFAFRKMTGLLINDQLPDSSKRAIRSFGFPARLVLEWGKEVEWSYMSFPGDAW